jgi:hypothetical protein
MSGYPHRDCDHQQLREEHPIRQRFSGVCPQQSQSGQGVDGEAEPHDAIGAEQSDRRHLLRREQPCIDADVDAREHREAERVQVEDEREGPERWRLADPDAGGLLMLASTIIIIARSRRISPGVYACE